MGRRYFNPQIPSELIGERSGLSHKIYMLVDQRLPKDMHTQEISRKEYSQVANESSVCWTSMSATPPDKLADTIRTQINSFTCYPGFSHCLELQENFHEHQRKLCGERTCEEFLNSNAYQGWKNRKTRGPSLLYVSGSGTPFI